MAEEFVQRKGLYMYINNEITYNYEIIINYYEITKCVLSMLASQTVFS